MAVSLRNSGYERFDRDYAEKLKSDYPDIWAAGGNIRGNDAYKLWGRALEGDDAPAVLDWIREREAWSARHFRDGAHLADESPNVSNVAGLVAQIKWGTVGVLGMAKMKSVINELKAKIDDKARAWDDDLSDAIAEGIRNKVDEYNEDEDRKTHRASLPMLAEVFKRGIGAYKTNPESVRPTVNSPEQWAYARINSFLYAMKNEKFKSGKHDTDLFPEGHPLRSKDEDERAQVGMIDGEPVFSTKAEAEAHAEKIGCVGSHTHELNGEMVYMACEKHTDATGSGYGKNLEGMENKKIETREAAPVVSSVNEENRTVEVTFGTTYPVQRFDGQNNTYFNEVLSFSPDHVRMERMTNGTAPVLNNHMNTGTDGVLGKVEAARLEDGHGVAVLRFAKTPDVDNTWLKVRDGIISGVSVGYRVHEYTITDRSGDTPTYMATSWEPLEVSIAPVPADPRSSVRSATTDVEILGNETIIEENKDMVARDAEPITKSNKANKMNLNDLKASRKAMENELNDLNVLSEMDDVQKVRFEELVGKIDETTKSIELKEKAEAMLKARAVAGAASKSEENEITSMKKGFSITESVRDLMDGKGLNGVASEMKQEAARQGHHGQGIVIPASFQRTGAEDNFQTTGEGAGFVATEVGAFIEGLTAPLEVEAWGTQVLRGLTGNVQFPREHDKATATAEGEVDDDAASGMNLDELTLSPKRYANTTKFSKQLMYQATGDVENIIANALRRGHERKVLSDIFTGGTGITGITGITGVNDIAAADTADYAAIIAALESAVLEDSGLTPNARFVLSPSAYEYISKAVNVTGVSALIDNMNNTIRGYNYHKTPYLADASSNVGQAVFGDWSNAILAYFGAIDIVVDPYSAKNTAQVEITMNQFIDFNLTQPAAFAFENGITAS